MSATEQAMRLESATIQPIALDLRHGRARDLFTVWFGTNIMMLTIITGLILAWFMGQLGNTIKIGIGDHNAHFTSIGIGMWLGAIMWANVWFIIWPNQKKNIGLVQVTPEERTRAARIAGLASRVNTLLSIPMLYCMTSVHFY